MKKWLFMLPLITLFICCSSPNASQSEELTHKVDSLQNVIKGLSKNEANYIEIPFSKLVSLFGSDSLYFDRTIKSLGFSDEGRYSLYFKDGFKVESKDIGVGHFMFHDIPMIYNNDWLIYTFPINRLEYYKTSILEKRNTSLYEQESAYNAKYDVNFIREIYIDRAEKLQYELCYSKNYGKIDIAKRDY